MKETSRLLRSQGYLFDAHTRVVNRCKGHIDLEVITRDVWSFTPDASYERLGGDNTYRFAVRETNLLGSGVELLALTKRSTERHSNEIGFKTNHFRGSRIKVRASFADNDDGSEQFLSVSQPFYALDTRSV
ncbi:MAG TPA: hypothetical protein DCM54_11595 [Gammaproteobacteria bacterium]|nr:hypothetical protein [Gammaproteobacteria bacterium]